MNSGSAMNFNLPTGVMTTTVNTGSEVISSSSWNEIASRCHIGISGISGVLRLLIGETPGFARSGAANFQ